MPGFLIVFALVLTGAVAHAQRPSITINAETPHGALLQQIGQEAAPAKKLELMNEFLTKFADRKDEVAWLLPQKQELHNQASDWAAVIELGDKIVSADPDALDAAVKALKATEARKDSPAVKAWATRTSALARKAMEATKPREGEDEAAVKYRLDYARQVDIYTEYALFNQAIQPGNPAITIEMTETLQKQNSGSQYVGQVMPAYILALNQAGQKDKAVATAEAHLEKDSANDDLLLLVADHHYNMKPKPDKAAQDKVILYAGKAVEVWSTKQKPTGIADADWENKKKAALGYAQWMHGMTLGAQNRQAETDKSLRAALPLLTNDQMKAGALFYLGLVNYQMGEAAKNKAKITEAVAFNKQCAAIKSPYQPTALANLKAIAGKYGIR